MSIVFEKKSTKFSGKDVIHDFSAAGQDAEEETTVSFAEMTDDVLKAYIETGEPFDKAGGYGIQARTWQGCKVCHCKEMIWKPKQLTAIDQAVGCLLVNAIQGNYQNVARLF